MSSAKDILKLLAEHDFFAGIPEAQLERLVPYVTVETYPTNEYVFRVGQDATHCYLIRQGQVALEVYEPHRGGAITVLTLDRLSVLGCSWLVPPYRWKFDARAAEVTRVLAIEASNFRRLIAENHEFGYEIMRRFLVVFAGRLSAALLQLSDMYA